MVAYMLMNQDKDEEAVKLLELNQQTFPENANAYDSLGHVYAKMGKFKKAKEYYEKSVEMNPNNMNAVEVLKHLD